MTMMLLEWVATSVFLILTVLLLRWLFGKRVSARLRYALWAVVLVRLLVPVQLFTTPIAGTRVFSRENTEQNIYKVTDDGLKPGGPEDIADLGGQDGLSVGMTTFPHAPLAPDAPAWPDAPEPPAAPDLTKAPQWLGWMWLGGAAAVAFVLLASNLRFFWRLRRVRAPLETADCPLRVYVAVGLPSPCLFGLVRPAVYVTPEAAADPAMLRHVLAHEYTHFRQGDHIWSFLRCAALAVHWWNPLVWLAAVLSQRDGELACDEGALARLGDGERAAYGNTLLALVTAKPGPGDLLRCATTMAGDKKRLKERITRIACAPKRWLWAAVAVVLATALACLCAFGQAEPEAPDDVGGFTPAYTMIGDRNVLIEGLSDGIHVEWSRGTNGGGLYLAGDMGYFSPKLAGEKTEGGAYWEDNAKNSVLHVRLNVEDDRIEDGTIGGFGIDFTIDLGSDTFTRKEFTSELGDRTIELTDQEMLDMAHVLARLLTEAEEYYAAQSQAPSDLTADLNRNGVPETLQVSGTDEKMVLEVWEGGKVVWSDEGYHAHAGYNALFLCNLDGQDCLLRYHPYMGQGWCDYSYKLFTLSEDGKEQTVQENHLEFCINIDSPSIFGGLYDGSFDPEKIAAFMDEINGLLANSVQLINTDADLLGTFQDAGRLVDDLWWLDIWEPVFTRDPSKSLLENLRDYQTAMEAERYAAEPEVSPVGETKGNAARAQLQYQGRSTQFDTSWDWKSQLQPGEEAMNARLLDLDGDGKDEIVFSLVEGHGTGCLAENLYVFDAETLEQYDTSGIVDMILSQVTSYADEENFYLSAPGVDAVIKKEWPDDFEYVYLDSICFDQYYYVSYEGGLHFCMGAALDGGLLCYRGELKVELRLDGGRLVCAGFAYIPAME